MNTQICGPQQQFADIHYLGSRGGTIQENVIAVKKKQNMVNFKYSCISVYLYSCIYPIMEVKNIA